MMEEEIMMQDTNAEDDFDDLFTVSEEEDVQDTNAPEEEPEAETVPEETEPTTPAEEPKYKVNFLGEEKELPVSELVTAAQKGMNYDHIKGELDALRASSSENNNAIDVMRRMAEASGMGLNQYLELCKNTLSENRVKAQVDRGVPEDVAKRLLELEDKEAARTAQEKEQEKEAERSRAFADLLREYPDLKTLPEEVAAAVAKGESPLNAYRAYDLKQVKLELAQLKKVNENKSKAVGSMQGDAPEEVDAFLAGFNSF